mgnify:CR=1 FL=1
MSTTLESSVYSTFDATSLISAQRTFFNSGKTKDVDYRIQQLKKLRQLIVDNEQAIMNALKADLNKSSMEAYSTGFKPRHLVAHLLLLLGIIHFNWHERRLLVQ